MLSKYIGTLLAGCCGDILGSQVEGQPPTSVTCMPSSRRYTDDTDMAIALATALLKHDIGRDISADVVHQCYADRYRPGRGYSQATADILEIIKTTGIHSLRGIRRATTNGSLMRIAPLALYDMYASDQQLYSDISLCLLYTHNSAESVAACFVLCKAIQYLVQTPNITVDTFITKVVNTTLMFTSPQRLFLKVQVIKHALMHGIDIDPMIEVSGHGGMNLDAMDTLAGSLYWFCKHYDNPVNSILAAASHGGDTDTIACITGYMCGARHGTQWIPTSWSGVEDEDVIKTLATDIYCRVHAIAITLPSYNIYTHSDTPLNGLVHPRTRVEKAPQPTREPHLC